MAASHALKIYKTGAIDTFIPKNACSTMRLSVAIANCCIADASGFEWIHNNNDTFRANLEDLIRATYTFVILRDPFVRLASCFLDKIVPRLVPRSDCGSCYSGSWTLTPSLLPISSISWMTQRYAQAICTGAPRRIFLFMIGSTTISGSRTSPRLRLRSAIAPGWRSWTPGR